jgi:hypothetical protein
LKDPKFIQNLAKANQNASLNQANNTHTNNSNSSSSNSSSVNSSKRISIDSAQNNNNLVNVDSAKFRSINEQIFNELILFQDPSYAEEQQQQQKPPRASRASASATSSNNLLINQQQKMYKAHASSSSSSQQHTHEYNRQYYQDANGNSSQTINTFTASSQTKTFNQEQSIPIGFDENLISIQLNNNSGNNANPKSVTGSIGSSTSSVSSTSSSSAVIAEQPIQIAPNPDNHKFVTLRPTPPKNAPPPNSSNLRRLNKPNNNINVNTNSVWSDSGYADSNRKSDNKSSYYSDISITVYDNIVGNNSAHTNTGTQMINTINSNNNNNNNNINKINIESPSQSSSHVAVTIGGPQVHALHPQMQPMNINQFNSQYVPNQLLPIQYAQTKSMSVNDFTGRYIDNLKIFVLNFSLFCLEK